MLVLSMASKRQRRPNVRLGEVGDIPAASACGFSHRSGEYFADKRWENDLMIPQEHENNLISGKVFPEMEKWGETGSEAQVSPSMPADVLHNIENSNPNSSKLSFDPGSQIKMAKSELGFGAITWKSRKRRVRGSAMSNRVFASGWVGSRHSPAMSSEYGADFGGGELGGFKANISYDDYYPSNEAKKFSDQDTSATEEQCPAADYWKEDAHSQDDKAFESGDGSDSMKVGGDEDSVSRWLEELGFGKYAGIFQMHGVDEQTLPLLTFADLKEMGVFAVGHRRRLYNAIQRLRRGS